MVCVVRGVWCVVRGVWCVERGAWCVVCGVWCVVCGAPADVECEGQAVDVALEHLGQLCRAGGRGEAAHQ